MVTIKDVAAAAGASVGSVSNVLNGKTDNIELIERVERVMKELGYRPDAKARSLKKTKSRTIGFIVPNLDKSEIVSILSAAESKLEEFGYHLITKISRNNRVLERKYLEQLFVERADGVVLYPCGEGVNYLKDLQKESTPVIIVGRDATNSVRADYKKAVEAAFCDLRDQKLVPGVILERSMMNEADVRAAYQHHFGQNHVEFIDCSGEKGFRAAYAMLEKNEPVSAFLAGNDVIAQGIAQAMRLHEKALPLIVVKERGWIADEGAYRALVSVDYQKIGLLAAEKVVAAAESDAREQSADVIEAEYTKIEPVLCTEKKKKTVLRMSMFDCPVTDALRMMTGLYESRTGVKIEIEAMPYDALDERVTRIGREKDTGVDILMADIVWMKDLAAGGALLPLEFEKEYTDGFLKVLIENYGAYEGKLYGLPFMSGALMLFYQKDLFEDVGLKRHYNRIFQKELLPPATWAEYNRIAEFFTQEYNERSPVPYGLSAIQGDNIYTTIGFLSRLWAYGGDVFANGEVCINSENARRALENFAESYRYVRHDKLSYNYNDAEHDFMSGESAMVVSYDAHVVNVNDYSKSKVAGNIGCAFIPGRQPVLGGWYLGVNRYSAQSDAAHAFLKWGCGSSAAVPFSLLGGTSLRTDCIEREDLAAIYPWRDLIAQTYEISRMRTLPEGKNGREAQSRYNHIIGKELNRVLEKKQGVKEALIHMEDKLKNL